MGCTTATLNCTAPAFRATRPIQPLRLAAPPVEARHAARPEPQCLDWLQEPAVAEPNAAVTDRAREERPLILKHLYDFFSAILGIAG